MGQKHNREDIPANNGPRVVHYMNGTKKTCFAYPRVNSYELAC